MQLFWKTVDWLNQALKILGACCLVGMMALTCVDVVGRYFGRPVFGSVELVIFMATLTTALALPYTHEVKGHIGVEILVRLLPPRIQTIIELATSGLSLALISLITWRMMDYAWTIRVSGQVSMNLEFPEHLVIYAVGFCFLIFTLLILKDIVNLSWRLLKGDQ
ncbi:MAG: TRAP transporter small permease [Deltaproteobacteria bacterium]|nr:TRAP transporter small permease [Deltaproteobacteria bacterium]